jgi:hypothetical protein
MSGFTSNPSVSGHGRYVAWERTIITLYFQWETGWIFEVFDDQIFLRDTLLNRTTQLSVAPDGSPGNGRSSNPIATDDEGYVYFNSGASNLIDGVSSGPYRYNIQTGTLENVIGGGEFEAISADGRYAAYVDNNDSLPGDTNGFSDIFVRDTQTGITVLASLAYDGAQADAPSYNAAISGDGTHIAFTSSASNLVPGGDSSNSDTYVRNLQTGQVYHASTKRDGTPGNLSSAYAPSLSHDGRYVAFVSDAWTLTPVPWNFFQDVYVKDLQTGDISIVSNAPNGTPGSSFSDYVEISSDGRYVGLRSYASNIDNMDGNVNGADIFIASAEQVSVNSIAPSALPINATTTVTVNGRGFYSGEMLSIGSDLQISNIAVVDKDTITMDVTVSPDAIGGYKPVMVSRLGGTLTAGSGSSGFCNNCISAF